MESKDGEELFTCDLSNVEPITEGRVGLRHMYTRSAIYKNFKIYKNNIMRTILSVLFIFLATVFVYGQNNEVKVDYLTNNGFGNAITGNSGEHYKGVTYVAYQGPLEDPYVAAYNHETGEWNGPYKAGTSLMGKDPSRKKKIDNHGKPTLIVDGEGYIHVVFGGHGGTPDLGKNLLGNYHYGKQKHVVTTKPKDISSWEEVDNITPFGTYSQFLKMDNGDIYLFYRHGAHRSNWVYQLSKDNCRTFEPLVSIVQTKVTETPPGYDNAHDSWYLSFAHGKGNDIVIAYNYHLCKGPKHDGERHNVYYMKFDTDKNEWLNVKGEILELPITKEHADTMTLVKNTGNNWTHNGTSTLDAQGMPHVTSYEGEDDGSKHGGPKTIQHYYWNGSEWTGTNTGLPVGAKGIMQAKSEKNINFLLGYKQDQTAVVGWWNSWDGAQSFKQGEKYILKKSGSFSLSHMIRNAHPDARVIASQKIKDSDYTKIFLLGDKGPVKRAKVEADVINE